ncbi:MAG TPA: ATP-binding protein [Syntrophorhabdus sp.]|nr:ATP-binding protein [Syntrophorhabdus sp.]HQO63387.1 ATP-binding protein [Syntrophorhabdus sp.]
MQQKMSLEKLRVNLIIILILISSVPLVLFAIVVYRKEADLVRKKVLSHLKSIVAQNSLMVDEFRLERMRDLSLLAATIEAHGGECDRIHLKLMHKDRTIYKHIFFADKEGRIRCKTGKGHLFERGLVNQAWFKAAAKGKPFMGELTSREGKDRYDLLLSVPVRMANGTIIGVAGAIVDFDNIASIMKNTGIGQTGEIYILNKDGVFLTSTQVEEGRSGERMEPELFAGYFKEVGPNEYIDYRGKKVVRVFKKLSDSNWYLVGEQDATEVFKDVANLRNLFAGFVVLLIALITLIGYLISRKIVHLLKSAYEQKKELEIQVIQKDKLASMGLLTAGIAHELNTPLASALLYTQMLKEDARSTWPVALEKLSSIEGEIKRGSKIVKNLLDFSRQSQTDTVTTDVNEVLGKLLDISEQLCSDRGIEIKRTFEKKLPLVKGNANILHQVFMNIVANAVDAMEKGGTLSVLTRHIASLHKTVIEIQDTGTGIPEELLGDVFDPFFTTKPSGEGTGLGLAISYSMVRKMGGNIRATSTCATENSYPYQPTGTTFTIELPALDDDTQSTVKERMVKTQ